jgi:hypothetical protein
MNMMVLRIAVAGFMLLLTFGSGYWMSRIGHPLNPVLFTFHKILAVLAIVVIVKSITHVYKHIGIFTGEWRLGAGLYLTVIITGALLSFESTRYPMVISIHKLTSLLLLLAAGILFFLLVSRIG